jgi:hypothetical protein
MKNKLFSILIFTLFSNLAIAQEHLVTGIVKRIEAHTGYSSARNIRVELEGVSEYCGLPSNNDTSYLQASAAPDNFNVFVSLLISSKMSKTPVRLYTHQGSEGCLIHRVDLI